MKTFLKMLLASILGGAILLFVLFIIFASLISLSAPKLEVQENTVLKINLNTALVERAQDNPFASFDPLSGEPEAALGLNNLLAGLKAAANDERIVGIYLSGGIPMGDAATVKALHDALKGFRSSGKFVYGYSEVLSQKGLYLATVADSFLVHPEGFVEWIGLNASVSYYKEGLEKAGLKPVVLRATGNKFKSAVEPFLRQDMSPENRLQLEELLQSIWQTYAEDISANTGRSLADLNRWADSFEIDHPAKAAEKGLIHGLAYQDQVDSLLAAKVGVDDIKEVNFLKIKEYAKPYDLKGQDDYTKEKVAVIIAQGGIQGGEGSEYTIGSERIAGALRKARKDEAVKAIVLRVNSPGGSALASETIWREVDLARREKPVIASMGGLAASGGYYISCFADTIVAEANTITGSIGAFGLFFTAEELLNKKLGINVETVPTHRYADLGTVDRELNPAERRILIRQIDRIYQTFLLRVAEGRNMPVAMVDSLGQGRVYSGADAQALGLVDVLGGLDTALAIAARKAGLEEGFRVVEYPEPIDPIQQLIEDLGGSIEAYVLQRKLGPVAQWAEEWEKLESMQGWQTRMPFELKID